MTDDDRPRFAEALAILAETFDVTVSEARAEGYFDALRDLPWPAVQRATREALATGRYFPRPVELRELALGRVEDDAEAAWGAALTQARRVGAYARPELPPSVAQTIEAVFGGWANFCAADVRGPEGIGWRKQFVSTYAVFARREQQSDRLLTRGEAAEALAHIRAVAQRKALPEGR